MCPEQGGALMLGQIWANLSPYFFTINTCDVRILIAPVVRHAHTFVWVVYYPFFALLINLVSTSMCSKIFFFY
jgi:hypothetical protein